MYKYLVWLAVCFALVTPLLVSSADSGVSTAVDQHSRSDKCEELNKEILAITKEIKTQLVAISSSQLSIDLARSNYGNCKSDCRHYKIESERTLKTHNKTVVDNKGKTKKYMELVKEYSILDCPLN